MDEASESNRFAPPQAVVADIGISSESGAPAGRWRRLGGALLDAVLLGVLVWILSLFSPWNAYAVDYSGSPMTHFAVLNQVLGFALFVAVNGYLLATRGQTVAKALLGMRIVRTDGSPVGFARAMLRYGAGYFFSIVGGVAVLYGLVDSLMIFRANRRCLHDEIAGTMVVRA